MYWINQAGAGRIQGANSDGIEVEALVTSGLSFCAGIALD
jgi:hypothetical protein